jgi:signal recognition particle receptor subunit beta
MAEFGRDAADVNARIVYWGIAGAGKRSNLQVIHSKLRPDHRGELREIATDLDPTATYATLPITLGEVGGVRTQIEIVTVPGGEEQAPTRKQLLDEVDGVVFVVDTSPEGVDANLAAFEELRSALTAYGRQLEEVPLVLQYNKRDLSDSYALEELHRKLQMQGVAAFEAVARDGTAVLQTLTTISKRVIRHLRERAETTPAAQAAPAATAAPSAPREPVVDAADTVPPLGTTQILDQIASPQQPPSSTVDPALLLPSPQNEPGGLADEAASLFEPGFSEARLSGDAGDEPLELEIASVGTAARSDARTVRVPLVLEDRDGRRTAVTLSIRIDPDAVEDGSG